MASYYVWSGATGSGNGSSWANAYTTLTAAFSGKVAGDMFYVAHDHAQSTATTITLISPSAGYIICVDRGGSVPPVSADRRATAQVATTGVSNIIFQGYTYYDGIIFSAGSAANVAIIAFPNTTGSWIRFDNCSLRIATTASTAKINLGNNISACSIDFNNTTLSFGAVGQTVDVTGVFKWSNTPSALLGTIPTTLFTPALSRSGNIECVGVDLSAAGSGKTIVGSQGSSAFCSPFRFIDCKLNAAVTKSAAPTFFGTTEIDFVRSGSSGNYAVQRHRVTGLLIEETTIVRSGGASDGTTPISWKVVTTASANYITPFVCPPIAMWNDTTGSAKTATIEGIWGGGAVPNDDEIWVDLEYLGSSSTPQGSFVNDGKADLLATAAGQTSSSETWGGSTTKFKLNVTFTAQQKGFIYARVEMC